MPEREVNRVCSHQLMFCFRHSLVHESESIENTGNDIILFIGMDKTLRSAKKCTLGNYCSENVKSKLRVNRTMEMAEVLNFCDSLGKLSTFCILSKLAFVVYDNLSKTSWL